VYAVYSRVEKTFTVRFYNGATLLATYNNVAYGSDVDYDVTPTYNGAGDAGNYVFTGWSTDPENITADLDCYAEYQYVGYYFRDYLNGTMVSYTDTDSVSAVASYAFAGETTLVAVSMPALTAVSENCFRGCTALTDVNLPAALAVNEYSFYYDSALVNLYLPEMTIMNTGNCITNLNALKELRLPKNTSGISDNRIFAFTLLELLDLGVLTSIGASISTVNFNKLETLILRNISQVVTPYAATVFHASSPIAQGTGKILVPRAMVNSYKADSSWGAYSDVIKAIEDYPAICNYGG